MKRLPALIVTFILFTTLAFSQITIGESYTENRINPIGLDTQNPRFSWVINSDGRQVLQTAYEISVDVSEENLVNSSSSIWSSGKINSSQSVHVQYNGPQLKPGTKYFWKVRVWDNKGNVSDWSRIAWWQTGLLEYDAWEADWISTESSNDVTVNYFRKGFTVEGSREIKKATAYLTSRGMYEAYINGKRVGDAYLTPGWTSYNNRIQYQAYDVKDFIHPGTNTIGVILGDGWYQGRISRNVYGSETGLLAQLVIEYNDGATVLINSDGTRKTSTGPVRISSVYDGEI